MSLTTQHGYCRRFSCTVQGAEVRRSGSNTSDFLVVSHCGECVSRFEYSVPTTSATRHRTCGTNRLSCDPCYLLDDWRRRSRHSASRQHGSAVSDTIGDKEVEVVMPADEGAEGPAGLPFLCGWEVSSLLGLYCSPRAAPRVEAIPWKKVESAKAADSPTQELHLLGDSWLRFCTKDHRKAGHFLALVKHRGAARGRGR